MMEKYKKLIFVIIVLLFFGCSSKSDNSSSLCNAGWDTCGSYEDCHCWKLLIDLLFLELIKKGV